LRVTAFQIMAGKRHFITGINHLPKCLAYFDFLDKRVASFCLDVA
jgi:hypothetical protein